MNHFHETIRALEQEIEGIDQRRGDLVKAIGALRSLADGNGEIRNGRQHLGNRPTDRPTEQEPRRILKRGASLAKPRSLPDDAGESVLAQLRKHGGHMKPAALAAALKLTVAGMRRRVKPLLKTKAVIATGATMSRVFMLPERAAKEVP